MMILGYWDIRGLVHSIRLLLEYTETPFEDKHYMVGDAPTYDRSHWLDEKEKLGLDFPNLPYLLDGDVKLTQSNTILRYIASKHGLCAETEKDKIIESLLENQFLDFRMGLVHIAYSPQFETLKGPYLEQLPTALARVSKVLGDRQWFVGDKITFIDFVVYDVLDQHQMLEPTCLQNFQNLQDFLNRFEALPTIAAYMKSPRFMKTPIHNRMAFWANKK
ncbi:glutathione S-transferase Mu 2-like [Pelobates fuscus]|uniref:glutathione S-transferase Mu 2-like n=1 Tax=Pelobates fuscus TaxID=191477 RepID=UPI002FE44680